VDDRIQLVLDDNINKLDIHYKSLLIHQTQIADSFYNIIINKEGLLTLYSKALKSSKKERDRLRIKLKDLIQNEYNIMKKAGVLQFQFVFPNNESFIRMHQSEKYGDDLSNVRDDLKYTNETKKISRGLVQGRVIHGFRNVYPLFDKNGDYLGAMDIAYASDNFQNELTAVSDIHAHFLINKNLFKAIDMKHSDIKHKYTQSSEHLNYMLSLTKSHNKKICIEKNREKLEPFKNKIITQMDIGKKFSFYTRTDSLEIEVVSFLPIKGFNTDKTMGWLVSYNKNKFIYEVLKTGQLINVFSFLLIALFIFFIYLQIMGEVKIKREHTLLDDVINSSEDMIFVTNFKKISFVNKKFKDFMSIEYSRDIPNITSSFVQMHNYLHQGLLKKNETFSDLINRTAKEDRIVSLLDTRMNPKAFMISIVDSSFTKGDFLVTLTDITKIKERELVISTKAFYDGLTGVYNRNKFDELVEIELKRDRRYKTNLSIAIVDIDNFKIFNDTFGHLIGDEVLIMIAHYLNENVRETDVFARWGGEEFVILFPDTSINNAKKVCEKLRIGISKLHHPLAGSITASFGVTQYQQNDLLATLFKRSDDALYLAKAEGRNKVCIK